MKYRLGSLTVEAIDTFVRVSVANIGGPDAPVRVAVTQRQFPKATEVAQLVADIRGHWPDAAAPGRRGRETLGAREGMGIYRLPITPGGRPITRDHDNAGRRNG